MKVSGARTVSATPEALWAFLMDPSQLKACLPGCESLTAGGPNVFRARMKLGVAFLKGTYEGSLTVVDPQPNQQFALKVEGGGALGTLTAAGTVKLIATGSGSTYVLYDGQAAVGGRIAAFGDRVVDATATRLIGLFFDCVASHVQE